MKTFKSIFSWIIPIVIGLAIALLIRQFVFTMARVDGPSMEPNLVNNERIIAWRQAKIKRNSVIVFNASGVDPDAAANTSFTKRILGTAGTDYVKRVVGMPGDTVAFQNGKILINGKVVDQGYISKTEQRKGTEYEAQPGNWDLKSLSTNWSKDNGAMKVPQGKYFVLGDHRSVSNDSRYWGFVPQDKVIGVVKTFPWSTTKQQRENVNDRS
ncbi:Signal peptidase I [Fructilactobacillus florum 8D]|uniref:Signal peptidase I n=2 Tax=Fructilactobacillus florum TaxID=640331 RepID=W9EGZ4_9LACO|nr:signal peptidase I [Fructilactobacillus florum]ETO40521.1 Signal peptidase I [Fructilactobacillus florum 8D]KRM91293.1 hypothetical protein FC87_GL001013 [Fructilactobacillus florum DSM 22689 = JCM 16035]